MPISAEEQRAIQRHNQLMQEWRQQSENTNLFLARIGGRLEEFRIL